MSAGRVIRRKTRLKNLLRNSGLTIASVMISLAFIEAGLRLFWQNPMNDAAATSESLFWRYDTLLGWAMQPKAQGKFTRPEFSVEIKTNSIGLRDDEIAPTKAKNEFRILLLGDSVTAGFEVARGETFEALLEGKLNQLQDERHYQVINAGFRGYGTDQEFLFLKSRGMALNPDAVILAFVPANDLEDNVTVHASGRIYAKPFFDYDADSSLALRGVPVPDYPQELQIYSGVVADGTLASLPENKVGESPIKKILRDNLFLYGFVAQRLKSANPRAAAIMRRLGILQQTTPASFLDFYRSPLPENWRRRWLITLDLILQIKRLCKENNIPLIVWMFPLKEQVYERDGKILLEGYGLNSEEYDFIQIEKTLQQFCEAHGIPFLSPLKRFRDEAAQGGRFHFISDNHFNAAGHALITEELNLFLQTQRILEQQ